MPEYACAAPYNTRWPTSSSTPPTATARTAGTTGSAFKPFAGIERERLSLTKGEDNLLIFGEETGHNAHCKTCGSLLYSVVRDGAFVHVTMGTLVDEPAIRPTQHIFVGSKAKWFTIADDLPQYEEHAAGGAD